MLIKNKIFLWKRKTTTLWQKTQHFGKITAFTAFDKNHGFCDFRDYLLSLSMDHSFPQNVEFWSEPRNLPISAELLCFHGILRNSVLAG